MTLFVVIVVAILLLWWLETLIQLARKIMDELNTLAADIDAETAAVAKLTAVATDAVNGFVAQTGEIASLTAQITAGLNTGASGSALAVLAAKVEAANAALVQTTAALASAIPAPAPAADPAPAPAPAADPAAAAA